MAIGKTLTVYLAADVSKLRGGLNSADRSLSGFSKNLSSMVGPALIGATAAAGAFAVAIGVEGVQAALADEAAMTKLNTTLGNLGFDAVSEDVQAFIDKTQYASGVSDDQLRPSLNRLLLATNDVSTAQNSLTLALDIAAGSGKSVEQVSNALGKAYEGNFGALSKLGVGLDSATLKSKDMSEITTALSSKFGGQAAAAAETYQGKIDRLSIAVDEAKETIGYALLNALDDVIGSMGGVGGLQGVIDETARGFGFLIEDVATLIKFFGDLSPSTDNANKSFLETSTFLSKLATILPVVGTYLGTYINSQEYAYQQNLETAGTVENLTNKYLELAGAIQIAGAAISAGDVFSAAQGGTPTGGYTPKYEQGVARAILAMQKLKKGQDSTAGSQSSLTKAVKEMDPALRRQIDLVKSLTSKVEDAGKALEAAREDMNAWIDSMAGNILSGIDLGTIQQFDDEGKRTGQSLLDGFNKQIEQAGLFGNYLKQLNSEGGPELRDAVAALGPEAGNKLAKEIIDQGLIPTMQSKLVDVRRMAETTAAEMVPPMLVAAVASASGYLIKMQSELDASASMLQEMGRKMGKTLSDAMVEEIRAALAAAGIATTGATNVMAGLPANAISAQAQVAQRIDNPFMNSTAIMQAIQNAILQSDQRLGRTGQVLNA
jgi:hypothetical protein